MFSLLSSAHCVCACVGNLQCDILAMSRLLATSATINMKVNCCGYIPCPSPPPPHSTQPCRWNKSVCVCIGGAGCISRTGVHLQNERCVCVREWDGQKECERQNDMVKDRHRLGQVGKWVAASLLWYCWKMTTSIALIEGPTIPDLFLKPKKQWPD